jgi:hypothetical protein
VGFFSRKPVDHRVAVYDTRPSPDDAEQFEPYFVAICECDWLGNIRDNALDAFADARAHDENVDPEIKRPVG